MAYLLYLVGDGLSSIIRYVHRGTLGFRLPEPARHVGSEHAAVAFLVVVFLSLGDVASVRYLGNVEEFFRSEYGRLRGNRHWLLRSNAFGSFLGVRLRNHGTLRYGVAGVFFQVPVGYFGIAFGKVGYPFLQAGDLAASGKDLPGVGFDQAPLFGIDTGYLFLYAVSLVRFDDSSGEGNEFGSRVKGNGDGRYDGRDFLLAVHLGKDFFQHGSLFIWYDRHL